LYKPPSERCQTYMGDFNHYGKL